MSPTAHRRRARARELAVLGAFAALGACGPGPLPEPRGANDPSDPSAAEGANPVPRADASPLDPASPRGGHADPAGHGAPTAPAHDHPGHGEPARDAPAAGDGTPYVCPMHPDVTASAPGACPRCRMKLVPKR